MNLRDVKLPTYPVVLVFAAGVANMTYVVTAPGFNPVQLLTGTAFWMIAVDMWDPNGAKERD